MICFFEHYRSVVLNAYFVLGPASSLDAFSSYLEGRSYWAVPCQTTHRPEAPSSRSSRTGDNLPANTQQT
jgi:hypothetical protein